MPRPTVIDFHQLHAGRRAASERAFGDRPVAGGTRSISGAELKIGVALFSCGGRNVPGAVGHKRWKGQRFSAKLIAQGGRRELQVFGQRTMRPQPELAEFRVIQPNRFNRLQLAIGYAAQHTDEC